MPVENEEQFEAWRRLKPGSAYAVRALGKVLEEADESPFALIDAYLFAKRSLAQSMQALLLSQMPKACSEFHELRSRIQVEMNARYADQIPEQYLRVLYGSQVHELLFAILVQSIGEPVDSARLRIATSDNTHTERRTRELRELGFNIATSELDGNQYYTLVDLEVDYAKVPGLVAKAIRKSTSLGKAEQDVLIAKLSE
jgi:tRNA nucleotidyltransferase/poly(A) polymerase